jgi:hypothetical protein
LENLSVSITVKHISRGEYYLNCTVSQTSKSVARSIPVIVIST